VLEDGCGEEAGRRWKVAGRREKSARRREVNFGRVRDNSQDIHRSSAGERRVDTRRCVGSVDVNVINLLNMA
jgi:hypothetical protein